MLKHLKKFSLLLALSLMLAANASLLTTVEAKSANSNDGQAKTIKYGDIVKTSITKVGGTVQFSIKGQKDDAVLISITPDINADKSLSVTEFKVTSGSKTVFDSTTFSHYYAQGVFGLPADGTYTVTVSRAKDATSSDLGNFILRLVNPKTLAIGDNTSRDVTDSELAKVTSIDDFYLLQSSDPFVVTYQVTAGTDTPSIE